MQPWSTVASNRSDRAPEPSSLWCEGHSQATEHCDSPRRGDAPHGPAQAAPVCAVSGNAPTPGTRTGGRRTLPDHACCFGRAGGRGVAGGRSRENERQFWRAATRRIGRRIGRQGRSGQACIHASGSRITVRARQRPCPCRLTRAAARCEAAMPASPMGGRSVHVAAGRIRQRLALAGGTSAADRAAGRGRPHL